MSGLRVISEIAGLLLIDLRSNERALIVFNLSKGKIGEQAYEPIGRFIMSTTGSVRSPASNVGRHPAVTQSQVA
jgi:hypothetical protein